MAPKVVCEEKHMGSRAIIVVCRNQETARVGLAAQMKDWEFAIQGRENTFNDLKLEEEIIRSCRYP